MDLYNLRPGDEVRTVDGPAAVILRPTEDGKWILVRYAESQDQPDLAGTEDLCTPDELIELVGDLDR